MSFGFETNTFSVPNLITDTFNIELQTCYFYKTKNNPLLFLCYSIDKEDYMFEESTEEQIFKNIHFKYNFIIRPYNRQEKFFIQGNGTRIQLIHPNILDFSSENSLTIRYIMEDPSLCSNIKLSTEYTDLNCKNLIGMKICFISFTHFRGKESGEYYTYHTNYFGKDIKYYDVPAITVILPIINFIDISIDDQLNQKVKYLSEKPIIYFETSYL